MSETSEEKALPASEKKIRDARKKGQVLHSPDMVSAIVILFCTLYLFYVAPRLQVKIDVLLDEAAHIYGRPFADVWYRLSTIAVYALWTTVLPILGITIVAILATNVAITRGFVFSVKPVEPDFSRLNPATGLKRLTSLKSIVEFGKALFKILALSVAFSVVFHAGLKALFQAPTCGFMCLHALSLSMLKTTAFIAIAAFVVMGTFDVFLQRWLFMREMRMTKSESKREHKDTEGDPLIRQERRKLAGLVGATKTGLSNAVLLIGDGGSGAVGIRYVRGETPVPLIVCRATDAAGSAMRDQARKKGIPLTIDAALAADLERTPIGAPVPDRLFQHVANALVANGLI
ncbi:EscU/YscU/HrcU family type III secretion system export apparatus switch protein (plasmid) [Sinorhizobium meliloti WSM1022]|uniref:Translocation protein in type III secretion system, RhcU n=1 Tax=Rhizobium meliloti TaxID=382 RepID=A0A6A7ZSA3_RHIML|nr:EscU/YscU/HrcU family type III secretion system export apparatus switch protein [Sinorhizobium meliloti]MDW9461158.1 translocation protein in type III secretion system, RhcU [Sinorhizobium meliloti]MDW9666271.1 translocation protein in type III secretion system, RhcU [Sinorhizobium meliloti]MDX0111303.1 translocation protein in type III secretion system, RhcU [Sinorhizobium meliloti]MDX0136485.1 translocation protein in type III secretion system, RhcU [Sinorhizobium meliloti]MDX0379802.1 tr